MTGKEFESLVKLAAEEQGIDYTRLVDAGYNLATEKSKTKRFTPKNICDCILFKQPFMFFVEVKHRKSSIRFDELKQLERLRSKHKPESNIYAGFIVMVGNRCFWLSVPTIDKIQQNTPKKSFNSGDASCYGYEIGMVTPKGKRKPRPELCFI
jgi:hypothetical protein